MTVSSSPTPDQNSSSTASSSRANSPVNSNTGGLQQRNGIAKKLNDPFQTKGTNGIDTATDDKLLQEAPNDHVPTARPPFTIADLRRAIPAHCFQRSYAISFGYLALDLALVLTLFYLSSFINSISGNFFIRHALWTLYWCAQGSVMTGLWVLGHECGHGGFSPSDAVNDIVGLIVHSLLLVPYYAWKISHRRHHSNTGNIERDEVFVPGMLPRHLWERRARRVRRAAAEMDEDAAPLAWTASAVLRGVNIVKMLTLGWPAYLLLNVTAHRNYPTDQLVNHFTPSSPIFSDRERWSIYVSDAALVGVFAFFYWVCAALNLSLGAFAYYYGVPYLIVNAFLVLITFLQHTDTALPHYDDGEWDWLRGALATVDRSFGVLDYAHHHIADTHVCHHLFSTLPHYHAQEATEAIKKVLGGYYREDRTPIANALWKQFGACQGLVPDAQQKGVYWF